MEMKETIIRLILILGKLKKTFDPSSGQISTAQNKATLTVTVRNYDSTTVSQAFTILVSDMFLKDVGDTSLTSVGVDTVNVAKNSSEEYSLIKTGNINGNDLTGKINVEDDYDADENTVKASYNYNSGNDRIKFEGKNVGRTKVRVESLGWGKPIFRVFVNVYDFSLNSSSSGDSSTTIDKVDFTGAGINDFKTIYLKIDEPTDTNNYTDKEVDPDYTQLNFDDGTNNEIIWDAEDPTIIKLDQGFENKKQLNIYPLKTGTTNLKCTVKINGKVIKEIVIPVNVKGQIKPEDKEVIIDNEDTITFTTGVKETVYLDYVLDSSIQGQTISYSEDDLPEISSDTGFQVDLNADKNCFIITYTGNSETTFPVTFTVKVRRRSIFRYCYVKSCIEKIINYTKFA